MHALRRLTLFLLLSVLLLLVLAQAGSADSVGGTPLQISNVQILAVGAQTATISWQTSAPATDQISYGIDYPVAWTPVSASYTTAHTVTLSGLTFNTSYTLRLLSAGQNGQTARAQLAINTAALGTTRATTANGVIMVNGQPLLPLMVFMVCQDGFQNDLEAGINLVMGDYCGESQFDWWAGRALTVGDVNNRGYDGRGFIGWYYPDEWDAHLPPPVDASKLGPQLPPSGQSGRISFLDMTSHVWTGAAQWPGWTRNDWQQLESLPDVLGSDFYPLTSWCNPQAFAANDFAQRELAATGKPSFQWIETRAMDCEEPGTVQPTPDTVRVETWLSLIGNAHAVGYFPHDFTGAMKAEITAQNRQITALAPALLAPERPSTLLPAASPVKVSVRSLNGAVYIILANSSWQKQTFRVTVSGLGDRPITTYDRSRTLTPLMDSFSDTLPGLGTRVYIATPDGS